MNATKTTSPQSVLELARTGDGFLVKVVGRGTMRESLVFHDCVIDCLVEQSLALTVDLSACDHLDSTFLGCLVKLHRRLGGKRLVVVAPAARRRLLSAMRLDRLLTIADEAPQSVAACGVPCASPDSRELGRHAMECHRELAQVEGPNQQLFARIADQLARDLEAQD